MTHGIVLDVGEYGSNNDSGILKGSKIDKMFDKNKMGIPESKMILGDDLELPYFLVGDKVFPLKNWLMKPHSRRTLINETIFHYILSRARRIIKNTFGIMVDRWRVFQRSIEAKPEKFEKMTLGLVTRYVTVCDKPTTYVTPYPVLSTVRITVQKLITGKWRNYLMPIPYKMSKLFEIRSMQIWRLKREKL